MPWVGFELRIPSSERAKTVHALDRSATVTGGAVKYRCLKFYVVVSKWKLWKFYKKVRCQNVRIRQEFRYTDNHLTADRSIKYMFWHATKHRLVVRKIITYTNKITNHWDLYKWASATCSVFNIHILVIWDYEVKCDVWNLSTASS
jgi:hypothetical protein